MDSKIVVWDDKYSVGSSFLDDQHKNLVAIINELILFDHSEDTNAKVNFTKIFKKAGDYAQTHFNDEEAILEKINYPDLTEQKKEHKSFMTEVWNEFSSFNSGNSSPDGLTNFLMNWLLNHIAVIDKKYTSYLQK
jgi:hemerythrin-like metal-binding protein